jgi:hypothetical protein
MNKYTKKKKKRKKKRKKHHQQQMLVRMWGKRNPHTLLVGMHANTTILENNMEASLKTKHRSAI